MKKVLSILVVLTMLLSCFCISASAEELGSYENPYRVRINAANATEVKIPAEGSSYVFVNNSKDTILKVEETNNTKYQLYYCGRPVTIEPAGTVSFTMVEERNFFILINPTDTEITVKVRLSPGDGVEIKGTYDRPEELTPTADGEGFTVNVEQHLIEDNEGYHYVLAAPLTGNMTVKVSCADCQWLYTVNNVTAAQYGERTISEAGAQETTFEAPVTEGDRIEVLVATHDPANEWFNPAGTVKLTVTFTPAPADTDNGDNSDGGDDTTGSTGNDTTDGSSGSGSDSNNPTGGEDSSESTENYVVDYEHPLHEGEGQYPLSKEKEYTVFPFSPAATGKYTFSAANASIALVSNNGMWITVEPSKVTVSSGNFEWICDGEGQEIWVAARGSGDTADITVTYEEYKENTIPKETYENKHTPEAFTYNGDSSLLQYVNTEDDTVDEAVLGADGYYHLNSADGPILYADLNDEVMSLEDANNYGQLVWIIYEDGAIVKTVDYTLAMTAYLNAMDSANGLYPLTEDLIEIFKNVGNCHDWYGDNGWVGGTLADAWMFACYFVDGAGTPQGDNNQTPDGNEDNSGNDTAPDSNTDNNNDGTADNGNIDVNEDADDNGSTGNADNNSTGSDNNTQNNNSDNNNAGGESNNQTAPQTGDEMVYIALVAVAAIAAFAILTVIRRRKFNK